MIEPDLDLEADLSIDSIKRAEIAGELAQRLGIGGGMDVATLDDAELEDLAKARTAASVTGWLSARLTAPSATDETPATVSTPEVASPPAPVPQDAVTGVAPKRLQLRPVLLAHQDGDNPADPASVLSGRRVVLYGDGGSDVPETVAARLSSYGADAVIVSPSTNSATPTARWTASCTSPRSRRRHRCCRTRSPCSRPPCGAAPANSWRYSGRTADRRACTDCSAPSRVSTRTPSPGSSSCRTPHRPPSPMP